MKAFFKEFGFWLFATMPMTIMSGLMAGSQGHWWGWFVFPAVSLCAAYAITKPAQRRGGERG